MPSDNKLAIKARHLAASYGHQDGDSVWHGADFKLNEGEFVAVLGPNGAGKSTLFKLILGLRQPSEGQLEILGTEPKKASRYVGYIPQRRNINSQTTLAARELIKLGYSGNKWGINLHPIEVDKKVDAVLRMVDGQELGNKPLGQLSGGELQRIFLAQALIDEPKILLLDEPLSNLDLRREVELVELVKRLSDERKITVLLIAHDLNPLLPYIDSVIYVANGQVVSGESNKVITSSMLSKLYKAPIEVLKDSSGRLVIVGASTGMHHE